MSAGCKWWGLKGFWALVWAKPRGLWAASNGLQQSGGTPLEAPRVARESLRLTVPVLLAVLWAFGLAQPLPHNRAGANTSPHSGAGANTLPHYIVEAGVFSCGTVPPGIERRAQLLRALSQTSAMWRNGWINIPIDATQSGIWEEFTIHGRAVRVFLRDYERTERGALYHNAQGVRELSRTEYAAVLDDLERYIAEAASNLYERFKHLVPIPASDQIEVTLAPGMVITLSDFLSQPEISSPASFVPDEIYFAPIAPWGAVFLGPRYGYIRRVFIHPEARIADCIAGQPLVLEHEMIHAQPSLQSLPMHWLMDVEIYTEASSGMLDDSYFALLHPYLSSIVDIVVAYFGYDYFGAGGTYDFRSPNMGLIWGNAERARAHQEVWDVLGPVLREWMINYVMPEFYSDPLRALAINMQLCHVHGFVEVAAASYFELAGLGGLEATQKWLIENESIIKSAWRRAQRETGMPSGGDWSALAGQDPIDETSLNPDVIPIPQRNGCPVPYNFSWQLQGTTAEIHERIREQAMEDYIKWGEEYVLMKFLGGGYW